MIDPDDSPKGFLERWSRKKIENEREPPAEPRATDATVPVEATPKPEFDLASLPSLDSITAATDIRAFLGPGVPKALARAALRRAWTADPAIRDFKGLAENDWDFTDPHAMPGFGKLPEGYDVKKLVAQIFGEDEKPPAPEQPPVTQLARIAEESASPVPPAEAAAVPAEAEEVSPLRIAGGGTRVAEAEIVQRTNNIASQQSIPKDETEQPKKPRQHGGALPQ